MGVGPASGEYVGYAVGDIVGEYVGSGHPHDDEMESHSHSLHVVIPHVASLVHDEHVVITQAWPAAATPKSSKPRYILTTAAPQRLYSCPTAF